MRAPTSTRRRRSNERSSHAARRWLQSDVDSSQAGALLGSELELIVAPQDAVDQLDRSKQPSPPIAIPFFENENKVVWYLLVAGADKSFAKALTTFLRSSLENGVYSKQYLDAFDRLPDYERLRSVIFS